MNQVVASTFGSVYDGTNHLGIRETVGKAVLLIDRVHRPESSRKWSPDRVTALQVKSLQLRLQVVLVRDTELHRLSFTVNIEAQEISGWSRV
jgi:hypothetical protein